MPLGLGKLQDHRMFDWGYDYEAEPALAVMAWLSVSIAATSASSFASRREI